MCLKKIVLVHVYLVFSLILIFSPLLVSHNLVAKKSKNDYNNSMMFGKNCKKCLLLEDGN